MRRGLPANGTLDGPSPRAHAVLLHDDCDALVAEAVAAGQHGPLRKSERGRESHHSKVRRVHTHLENLHITIYVSLTSWPRGRAQMGHGSGFSPPVDLSWDCRKDTFVNWSETRAQKRGCG